MGLNQSPFLKAIIFASTLFGALSTGPVAFASEESNQPPCEALFGAGILQSRQRAERLAARAGKGLSVIQTIDPGPEQYLTRVVSGVPPGVKTLEPTALGVVRHYTRDIDAILSSKALKTGPRELFDRDNSVNLRFKDLTGIFFTTTEFNPNDLSGLANGISDYVDFELPPQTGVLYLKDGYYLIPTTAGLPEWLADTYTKYKKTGQVEEVYRSAIMRLEKDNWEAPIAIPIRIVAFQKNAKRVEVHATPDKTRSAFKTASDWAAKAGFHEILQEIDRDAELTKLLDSFSGSRDSFQMGEQGRLTKIDLSIRQHVVLASEILGSQLPFYPLDEWSAALGINLTGVLKFALVLHDIGKPVAVEKGDKHRQHEFTIPILKKQMQLYGFSKAETQLAVAIVDHDILGDLAKGKITVNRAASLLMDQARGSGLTASQFFTLQSLFFIADAGSYPSLNHLFGYKNGELVIGFHGFESLSKKMHAPGRGQ